MTSDVRAFEHPRFALRSVLGRGSEGTVYEAFDRDSGDAIALKFLAREGAASFAPTFDRLHRLEHPNVVRMRELFAAHDPPFFTMDLAVGIDFISHVRADVVANPKATAPRPTLPLAFGQPVQDGNRSAFQIGSAGDLARLRSALAQVTAALACIHAAGMVHCDLHPSNVRVDGTGHVVLVDFGLARRSETPLDADVAERVLDAEGIESVAGTSAYMAPERGRSGPARTASDMYALGVLLFEGLTGALPFTGSADDVIRRKATLPAAPPAFVTEGVPDDLDRLAVKLLDSDPTRRPDAQACLVALDVQRTSSTDGPNFERR